MALVLIEQVERADSAVRLAERVQQPQESPLMRCDSVGVVALGVGIEIDLQRAAVAAVVDLDRQVFDRTEREIAGFGAMPGEAEIIVEPHDIQVETEQRAAVIDVADVPAKVPNLITLVFQTAPDFRRRFADGVGHGHPGIDCKSQRQDIGHHAGRGARGAAAGRDRQAEHDVRRAGHAMQVNGGGGGEEMRKAGAHPVRRPFEFLRLSTRHECRAADEAVELAGPRTAQACPFRTIGQAIAPVLPVACELLGGAVAGLLVQDGGERTERAPQCRGPDAELGVNVGDTPRHQRHAKPVHDDVVIARVPEVTVGGDFEQGESEHRPVSRVDGPRQVGPHPGFGLGARVGRCAEVEVGEAPVGGLPNELPRTVRLLDDPHAQGFGFDDDLPERLFE